MTIDISGYKKIETPSTRMFQSMTSMNADGGGEEE